MNEKEREFINSIENKIKFYSIPTTLDEALDYGFNQFVYTNYNDNTTELVDVGIERFLCSKSPLYFISKYAWIKLPRVGIVPYEPYYFQREILKIIENYQRIIFDKTRQCGISTTISLYVLWRALFKEAENIDVVSIKQDKAKSFVEKMRPTLSRLPSFLKPTIFPDNKQELGFIETNSSIISETQSENAGRSDSLSLLVLDEMAHYRSDRMVRSIISAAAPTLSKTGGIFIGISTPNGISGPGAYYYEQVNELKYNADDYSLLISIDWWEVPDDDRIPGPKKGYNYILKEFIKRDYFNNPEVKKEAQEFFKKIENNWKENEWLKAQHSELGDVKFKQEILHNFILSGNPVFTSEALEQVKQKIKPPVSVDKIGKSALKNFWIWHYPEKNHRYIVTVDPSTGTSREYAGIQVFDVTTYSQAAEFKGMVSTKVLGKIAKIIARYYNQAYLIIECNGIGEAVFNEVYYHDTDPYKKVYKQKKTKNGITRMTGWITDTNTRKLITDELINWIEDENLLNSLNIYSERLYNEFLTWIWNNNKPEHSEGAFDDLIMAMALAIYLRNKAEASGESFLINEEGNLIEYNESKDKVEENVETDFDFLLSEVNNEQQERRKKEIELLLG